MQVVTVADLQLFSASHSTVISSEGAYSKHFHALWHEKEMGMVEHMYFLQLYITHLASLSSHASIFPKY